MNRYRSAWLPTPGNIIFTLIVMVSLFWVQNAGASILASTTASTTLIPYQGRLSDSSGSPRTGSNKITFALYTVPVGGTALWSEPHNSVTVNQGLFNVMLGSIVPIPQSLITDNNQLYLGVTIDNDSEMMPRVQLGSVPFAIQALTVSDGSVTTPKIADGAVTIAKLGPDVKSGLPTGSVIMWSGAINTIPSDWQLCDGTSGTPDLRNHFVVGAGSQYVPGNIGGTDQITLTIAQMPSHNHTGVTNSGGDHQHQVKGQGSVGSGGTGFKISSGATDWVSGFVDPGGAHTHTFTTDNTGDNQPFDNRPPYYALAFICKK